MTETKRSVGLVGAYERENFGDLLFLLITRHYLGELVSVPTAPFAQEASNYLGEPIASYVQILEDGECDAVWVVGGEVGATSMLDAYRMSASDAKYESFKSLSRTAKEAALLERTGLAWSASPYIPRLSTYPGSRAACSIINSVGIGEIRNLRTERLQEVKASLAEADYLSVRDSGSSELLTAFGLPHTLAPDLVHSLAITRPRPERSEPDVALVQVRARVLAGLGTDVFAEALARSKALENRIIRLFIAGSARGHDSVDLYEQVVEAFRRMAPGRPICISTSVTPFEKVDEIAAAGLWVGTSLHGYIVSTAYGVPRVGLALEKVARYARTWDETMPCAVGIEDLDGAVDEAFGQMASREAARRRARELGEMAERSILDAVAIVEASSDSAKRATVRMRHAEQIERDRRTVVHRAARLARAVRGRIVV